MKRTWIMLAWLTAAAVFLVLVSCGSQQKDNWFQKCRDAGGRIIQTSTMTWICVDGEGKILW